MSYQSRRRRDSVAVGGLDMAVLPLSKPLEALGREAAAALRSLLDAVPAAAAKECSSIVLETRQGQRWTFVVVAFFLWTCFRQGCDVVTPDSVGLE